jgi:hypothetical protein
MNPSQAELVREVLGQREALVQACWAQQLWARKPLKLSGGEPLEVLFPGWLNRGPGPDFTEARLMIGNSEHRGDVEIHLEEADWQAHGHRDDPRYGRVALHVVLRRGGVPALRPGSEAPLPVFNAGPFLSAAVLEVMHDPETLLRRYESLPGRCGLRAAQAGPDALARVIAHAAEVRARAKSDRLLPAWRDGAEEQLLFELLFQSLGYRPYAEVFRSLARRFPLDDLAGRLQLPIARARVEVLSRWFGSLGLLERPPPQGDAAAGEEFAAWRDHWLALGLKPLTDKLSRAGSRPLNSPERRMVGMFHHLRGQAGRGWLKGWLAFLADLDGLRDRPEFRPRALRALHAAFDAPREEPWLRRVAFHAPPRAAPAQLIGADRIAIAIANAIVPFFLAYARRRGDTELEKVLYRLFIVLPAEGPNRKTRFMRQRLLVLPPTAATLRTHQGLLQIHQDFCVSFQQGCQECRFPDLIAPRVPQAGGVGKG